MSVFNKELTFFIDAGHSEDVGWVDEFSIDVTRVQHFWYKKIEHYKFDDDVDAYILLTTNLGNSCFIYGSEQTITDIKQHFHTERRNAYDAESFISVFRSRVYLYLCK